MLPLRFSILSQATSSVLFSDRGNLHLAAWSISSGGSYRDVFWRRLQAWPRPSAVRTGHCNWAGLNGDNPLVASVGEVGEFLTSLFDRGRQVKSLGISSRRSPSGVLSRVNGGL